MNNCLDRDHMETQGDHKIQTETEISNGLQETPYELNLLDDLPKVQTKTKEEADQKELDELESQSDLQKLPDESYIENSDAIVASDDGATNADDLENDGHSTSSDELTCDSEIFGDIITKIKAFVDKLEEKELKKTIFIDEWQIFNDFFNLMEKHETNLKDEDLLVVKRGLKVFIHTTYNVDSEDVFTNDKDYWKEIFYMYFNLFNLPVIQNYLKNAEMPDHLKIIYRPSIFRILKVIKHSCFKSDLGLNDRQRPTNYIELLSLMLNYVKTDLKSSDLVLYPSSTDASIIRQCILDFLWNYTDKTVLVRDLIEVGCSETMIDELRIICKTPKVHIDLQRQIITIIYNISRHNDGVKQLNALSAAEIIKEYQSSCGDSTVNATCCMTLVLLSTSEQIKNDSNYMNDILDTLLEMVYKASVSSDHCVGDAEHGFLHLSELFIVFVKLFNDDRTLDYIMEQSKVDLHTSSTIEFFINQLIYYYFRISDEDPLKQATCTALVNILWSLSFQDKYKQELKNANTKFKELIQNLIKKADEKMSPNEYIPQYIENIQKAATGLLFNINELIHSKNEQVVIASTLLDNNQKPMIMISYSHEDTEFCKQLYNEILKRGYDIWIDFKFLKTGDLWEQICAGMKRASVIVCLMSEDYCKSKSCRWEATYALDKLQTTKSVIPVFLQKHELPDWLEIRTAVLKYVRFHDLNQLENDKLFDLIDMIENSLPSTVPRSDLSLHQPILPTHHEPVSTPITKVNQPTLHTSNILPVNLDESVQTKPTKTKIENQDNSSKNIPVLSTTTDERVYPEKEIKQWNKTDISQWFQHNNILTELRDLCRFEDGYELLNYANIFLDTEKLQYQIYSDEFLRRDGITSGQKPLLLHEFTKFSNALRKLEKFNKST